MKKIEFHPVGIIRSPFKTTEEIPRQSIHAADKTAVIEIREEFKDGLKDLEKLSYIIVLFQFHQSKDYHLITRPHGSKEEKGVFATRSPHRPNPIGMSIVKLLEIDGCNIKIQGVDMLDGTPVIDIKPYSPGLNPQI